MTQGVGCNIEGNFSKRGLSDLIHEGLYAYDDQFILADDFSEIDEDQWGSNYLEAEFDLVDDVANEDLISENDLGSYLVDSGYDSYPYEF
ncbi:MAG: hypothetical protein ACI88L_000341 [Candidatus Paceibacteria bacterium]|jgi:hypothetical protein